MNELGVSASQILDTVGVGENEPVDAEGPLEDPAERSVIINFEAYEAVPVFTRPDPPVVDDGAKKFTKWNIWVKYEYSDTLSDYLKKPEKLPGELIKEKAIKMRIENREEENPRTLHGDFIYRGLQLGVWLTTPQDQERWIGPVPVETNKPIAEMEWHMVSGTMEVGGASGGYISGGDYIKLIMSLGPTKDTFHFKVQLTPDRKEIGVQLNKTVLPFIGGQLHLTNPKPELRAKEEQDETGMSWTW